MSRGQAVFLSHGAPIIAIENDDYTEALKKLGQRLGKPRAVVVVSAHWETPTPMRATRSERPQPIYDFGGFPSALYEKKYLPPGDPELADRVAGMLSRSEMPTRPDPDHGLDHGVWTPMVHIFPRADVPIVQVSLPFPRDSRMVYKMGKILSPLRDEGIVMMATGGVVHNLRMINTANKKAEPDAWAKNFDTWVKDCLETQDLDPLLNYRREGPRAEMAVQGPEHFEPLFFALGAAENEALEMIYEGFHYGNLSMRSFILG